MPRGLIPLLEELRDYAEDVAPDISREIELARLRVRSGVGALNRAVSASNWDKGLRWKSTLQDRITDLHRLREQNPRRPVRAIRPIAPWQSYG
jgi:hypothetical protein